MDIISCIQPLSYHCGNWGALDITITWAYNLGPFSQTEISLASIRISTWISNYIHVKEWDIMHALTSMTVYVFIGSNVLNRLNMSHISCVICIYYWPRVRVICEMLCAFVWLCRGVVCFDPNIQNLALWLTLALPSPNRGRHMLTKCWIQMPHCHFAWSHPGPQ